MQAGVRDRADHDSRFVRGAMQDCCGFEPPAFGFTNESP
ncbi:hypothetical protein AZ78_0959 [Lysobacter capsici AZ78]|uniref:Uncharacterized protein n=1 Tax=Lysobacter capsici AZ78 TaxID=1444315 RepID=A0A120AFQ8_9GAMM|nr:hypothetical protein AZ78_0959 [Lysobacter capsici AZ78]